MNKEEASQFHLKTSILNKHKNMFKMGKKKKVKIS